MTPVLGLIGLVVGGLLLAAGLATSIWWLILLGFVVMPVALFLPLTRPVDEEPSPPEKPAKPGQATPAPDEPHR